MTALERAFASNEATPILTVDISHSAITGGVLRLARAYSDLTATIEGGSTVTFLRSGIGISYPEKSTEGRQDLNIQIDNVSNVVWQEINSVVVANRTTQERAVCKMRAFLESDLTAPQGEVYTFTITGTSITRSSAVIRATYTPIPDTEYPRHKYYSNSYPGVKYA